MIHQIFISDENEMHRCQKACAKRVSILVGGIDARDGGFRVHRGIVKSVEDFPAPEAGSKARWRITVQG